MPLQPLKEPGVRSRRAGSSWLVLIVSPAVVVVGVAALHTVLRGSNPGQVWGAVYAVGGLVLIVGTVLAIGPRQVPAWAPWAALAGLLASMLLLQSSERMGLGLVPAGLIVMWLLSRAPRVQVPPPTSFSRVGPSDRYRETDLARETPVPDHAAPRAQMGPPVQVPLLTTTGMLALLGGMGLLLLMGIGMVWVAIDDPAAESSHPVALFAVASIGVLMVLPALAGIYVAVGSRGDTLTIDGSGLSRHGGLHRWHLPWEDVRAIGIRDLTRVVPNVKAPTPRRMRERRDVRLLVSVTDPTGTERRRAPRDKDLPKPFTHEQRLPDLSSFRKGHGLVAALDRALSARVPHRYLGVSVERPGQQLPPRDD